MPRRAEKHPAYLEPYEQAVNRHGPGFEATLWRNRSMQRTRFEVFQSMLDLTGRRILDAGCGLGDLAAYLSDAKIQYARYIGLDGVADVIRSADRRKLPRAEFHIADFVADPASLAIGEPEIICFSGSLNTVPESDARAVIDEAFRIASHAVLFNFLSDRCPPELLRKDTGPAKRFNTLTWLEWAMRMTPDVAFRQDYFGGHDATIAMRR